MLLRHVLFTKKLFFLSQIVEKFALPLRVKNPPATHERIFILILQIVNRLQCGKYVPKHEFVRKIFFVDKVLQSFSTFQFGNRRGNRRASRFPVLTLTNHCVHFSPDTKIKFCDLRRLPFRYHMILCFNLPSFLMCRFSP